MVKHRLFFLAILTVLGSGLITVHSQDTVAPCRHTKTATHEDRVRREQAIFLAELINQAEARAARETKQYQLIENLGSLPAAPRGFELKLFSNGSGYIFSLKDSLDACRFAVFSDEGGFVYEKALDAPLIPRR